MSDPVEIIHEPDGSPSLVPDDLSGEDFDRPALGSQALHASSVWEEAAVLGALRDGLIKSGFDPDQAWELVFVYARMMWASKFETTVDFSDDPEEEE